MKDQTESLLDQLKALGDTTRLRLFALCRQGECSVSELTAVMDQSQPRISQQLKVLCDADLLVRFRDGKRVYYRVPEDHDPTSRLRQLLALVPGDDDRIAEDWQRMRKHRGKLVELPADDGGSDPDSRSLHRAILDLTVTASVGDLLDVGCGRGSLLKLLASRANRAVGVDIDANARRIARAELLLAGLPNCSLRKGDMYDLPFKDGEFNTIIIDDVLADARDPVRALSEARRLLKPGGRLFILESVLQRSIPGLQKYLAEWSATAGLRLAQPRLAPRINPVWLLTVAVSAESGTVAA